MDKYAFDKDTGIYSLSLRCVWQDFSTEVFLIFLTEMGHIKILLKKNFGRIDFMIKADESNSSYLTAFKSCTARMPNKQHLYFGGVKLQNSSRPQFGTLFLTDSSHLLLCFALFSLFQIDELAYVAHRFKQSYLVMTIPLSYLDTYLDGKYYLDINISSQEVSVPTPPPLFPPPAPHPAPPYPSPKNISEKVYDDSTFHDVYFIFGGSSTSSAAQTGATTVSTIGAHKLILSQWPYFKMMFESGFSEGGPGEKKIQVKDSKAVTFKLLLQYLYTERIPQDVQPTIAYKDALTNTEEASWEDLYLVADRYEIDGLRQSALGHLLPGSNSESVIPFLFRTAYLFEELRAPVVRYIATVCSSEMAEKTTQQLYTSHPQCIELFGEIITQLNARVQNFTK
ncbi:hypothetical protein BGZ92_000408 [Podila epicladia]|nr:hypothetical protein BGZ92_000408 [Podila epicladia]